MNIPAEEEGSEGPRDLTGTHPATRDGRWRRRGSRNGGVAAAAAAAALLVVALVVGCAPSGAAPADTPDAEGNVVVLMKDNRFAPETVRVPVGGTVTWVNEDKVSHNAVADDGSWKTEIFTGGGSVTLTMAAAGTYPYVCTLHPGMVGTVIVE